MAERAMVHCLTRAAPRRPMVLGAVALCVAMLLFSLGPGPFTFVVINEMLPLSLRGKVVALSMLFNRCGSGTIALTFLTLKDSIGVFAAFSLYAALGLAVSGFYFAVVPESTGKSLELLEGTGDEAPTAEPHARSSEWDNEHHDQLPTVQLAQADQTVLRQHAPPRPDCVVHSDLDASQGSTTPRPGAPLM